ncbi:hypothetical protein [Schaalia hyovaginalis]|uniref:hypothetical protein n=1 Tax=Schaalia hyovaginalis TaxID=29316 RepID=UPI0012B2A4D3|nr:hypothetical protein [Schaalia hyovaginalis]MCI6411462.1 hypothetical protein [Schaalia hyovaginalis]MCI7512264.1 hypothetical protein [Schaalia hyovaginalis]MST64022.1 hypothetical protein [Schaalia hyovaginalis]
MNTLANASPSARGREALWTWGFTVFLCAMAIFIQRLNWVFIVAAVIFGARAAYLTYRWYRGRKEERASS